MATTTTGATQKLMYGYETTVITRSELSDEGLKGVHERVAATIAEFGGEMVLTEDWGRKKLAYPIHKESRGHYSYFVYTGNPGVVHEIERHLRIHDHVIRFLTVNLEKEFNADVFRKQRADIHAAAKRREEEREARREERMAERRGYDRSEDRYERSEEPAAEASAEIAEE